MKNEDAPEGAVLVKYIEPSFGGWYCQYGMAYFDNPNDYEDENVGQGWLHDNTNKTKELAGLEETTHVCGKCQVVVPCSFKIPKI